MNAKQRRNARRGLTPSAAPAQPLVLLALLAEHEAMKAKVRAYIEEQQTSLDDLRLQMQYLVFDNECLRRENAELRARLGERP